MQDMNNIEGAPASMAPAACFTACTFSTRVGRHILHHAYFYLVNSIEGAPTRMLHSVYIFSTRVGSHILHHACFFFCTATTKKREESTHALHSYVCVCVRVHAEFLCTAPTWFTWAWVPRSSWAKLRPIRARLVPGWDQVGAKMLQVGAKSAQVGRS